jgi:hypothetical protein
MIKTIGSVKLDRPDYDRLVYLENLLNRIDQSVATGESNLSSELRAELELIRTAVPTLAPTGRQPPSVEILQRLASREEFGQNPAQTDHEDF